ncbi:single-stranded DNA-binding protein [Streptomyces sp. ICBB 8177]|uniref:single-stranded DNA-binding protein n=1 Tax=Streptomyces sp. ICBB 8177 TaxID=563922 RepID=UPI000D68415B|nr:single-stranded DNA-binding protein [Streptomyces sp. ICBB 8177]PWI44525.1 single-stranded DNA-binding protein [Streptomyces sp. ICBB 8177]
MAVGETPITIVGNLTDDPELRFTPSGAALAKFSVASTPRTYDKTSGQWRDGTAMFLRCTAWRDLAEHIADSLTKGTRVVVTGRLRQHNWQNEQGENRSMLGLEVDDIGPSLMFATAKTERAQRKTTGTGPATDAWSTAKPANGGWGTPAGTGTGQGGGAEFGDEPPF